MQDLLTSIQNPAKIKTSRTKLHELLLAFVKQNSNETSERTQVPLEVFVLFRLTRPGTDTWMKAHDCTSPLAGFIYSIRSIILWNILIESGDLHEWARRDKLPDDQVAKLPKLQAAGGRAQKLLSNRKDYWEHLHYIWTGQPTIFNWIWTSVSLALSHGCLSI